MDTYDNHLECTWFQKNYFKHVFSGVPISQFELSSLTLITTLKTDSSANVSCECFENTSNCWGIVCAGIFFSKVTEDILAFHIDMLWIALSEILRDSLLPGFANLQPAGCNFNKNKLLIKFLKGVSKISEYLQEELCNEVPSPFFQICQPK